MGSKRSVEMRERSSYQGMWLCAEEKSQRDRERQTLIWELVN